ncbi:MAG TPA: hypothetical protein VGS21_11395 [Acidimicrobiales bacterium]|nr:hypothetical protein [Acidimicrobiales bacterium]
MDLGRSATLVKALGLAGTALAGALAAPAALAGAAVSTPAAHSAPASAGTANSELGGVSCTSATFCMDVGNLNPSPTATTHPVFGESWNGTSWTLHKMPLPAGIPFGWLNGVSCTSTTFCVAVGQGIPMSGPAVGLIETWNGTTWAVTTGAKDVDLYAVSCPTDRFCAATGSIGVFNTNKQYTYAETFNGSSWRHTTTATPSGASFPVLQGVSCVSATTCEAVGNYDITGQAFQSIAAVWNGSTWREQTVSTLPNAATTSLSSVSCTSADACTAVGYYSTASSPLISFAAKLENGSFVAVAPGQGSGWLGSSIGSISCVTRGCVAAGQYATPQSSSSPLAYRVAGSTWTKSYPLVPSGDYASLWADSCSSTTFCVEVGEKWARTGGNTSPLVEMWNGSAWKVSPVPFGS